MEWTEKALFGAIKTYGSQRAAARALGIPESTFRSRLKRAKAVHEVPEYGFSPEDAHLPATHVGPDEVETTDYWADHGIMGGVRRYILTSAQNNTKVHADFMLNLEVFAEYLDAKLLVSFSVYDKAGYKGLVTKGKGSTKQRDIWWDKAIEPHTINNRVKLARRLSFCGELDVLATNKKPLSGLESYCGRSSIIIPHNKFEFQCVASRKGHLPKEMFTTGSVTERNFIQRKTGQVASFHHVLGALLVEVCEDGYWHAHHLNADEKGNFYWLNKYVSEGTVQDNKDGIEALIAGDIHYEKNNWQVLGITFENTDCILNSLKPKQIFLHDLIDFTSRNHHERKNLEARMHVEYSRQTVKQELQAVGLFLHQLVYKSDAEIKIVPSNHHEAFRKWIHETDWREDMTNADIYLAVATAMMKKAKHKAYFDPLEWCLTEYLNYTYPTVEFLKQDERCEVKGIECNIHGHIGPSGSRGNPGAYSRLPFKTFTAHTHSPSINNGCYTVGVSGDLDMGYNKGPQKWMHCHGIIYPNGKRAFIFIKNNRWRA